jgi:hypothetical protein
MQPCDITLGAIDHDDAAARAGASCGRDADCDIAAQVACIAVHDSGDQKRDRESEE